LISVGLDFFKTFTLPPVVIVSPSLAFFLFFDLGPLGACKFSSF